MICLPNWRSTKHTTVIDSIFPLTFYFLSRSRKMWILSSSWVGHFGGSSPEWSRQWQVKSVKSRQGKLAISSRSFCFLTSLPYELYSLYQPVSLFQYFSHSLDSHLQGKLSFRCSWGKEPSSREVSKSGSGNRRPARVDLRL